jgi:simple sugar transport system substrate-binding protein
MKKQITFVIAMIAVSAILLSSCNSGNRVPNAPTPTRRPTFTPLAVTTSTSVPTQTIEPTAANTQAPTTLITPVAFNGPDPAQKPLRFVLVQHARCTWNAFWCPVEQGIKDAAHDMNVSVSILSPDKIDVGKTAEQIDQAVGAKPDGIAVTISDPKRLREPMLKAIDSGIPIIAYNAGSGPIEDDLPYLTYIGMNDYQSGYLGAYRLMKAGAKFGVCLTGIPELTLAQNRCRGFQDAFAEAGLNTEVVSTSLDPTEARQAVQMYASANPNVDAYFTTDPPTASALYAYLRSRQNIKKVIHATYDVNAEISAAINDGTTLFAIDQQPYLQGYSAIFWLTMINRYGLKPALPVLSTGPYFVDKGNIGDRSLSPSTPLVEHQTHFYLVHHGLCSWDAYWCIIDQGANDAAQAMNVKVTILGPESFDLRWLAGQIDETALANPDGLAVTIPDPVLLHEPILRAIQAGYPVLAFDTGAGPIKDNLPYLTFLGQDEYQGGYLGALRLIKAGAKSGVCLNQQMGQIALDRRCQGVIDAFKEKGLKAEVLDIGSDSDTALQRLTDYATAHLDVNAFITLGAVDPGAATFYNYLAKSGQKTDNLLHGTFDLSPNVVTNIENGTTLFAIDAQPYLQGYSAVMFLALYVRQQIRPALPITPTGPAFVDQSNVALVKQLAGKYR